MDESEIRTQELHDRRMERRQTERRERDQMVHDLVMALEPFALISEEGVIQQQEGHVTVTTCAEYFHRAKAAIARAKEPR